jgi:hypothetical protein
VALDVVMDETEIGAAESDHETGDERREHVGPPELDVGHDRLRIEVGQQVVDERRRDDGRQPVAGDDRTEARADARSQIGDEPERERQRDKKRQRHHHRRFRRDRQLEREQDAEPEGEPPGGQFRAQIAQQQERNEREEEDRAQIDVAGADLAEVRGREPEEIAADQGRPQRAREVPAEEIRSPRCNCRQEHSGDVVGHDRPEESGERRQDERKSRCRWRPREVDARSAVERVSDERIGPAADRVPPPSERPDVERGILVPEDHAAGMWKQPPAEIHDRDGEITGKHARLLESTHRAILTGVAIGAGSPRMHG